MQLDMDIEPTFRLTYMRYYIAPLGREKNVGFPDRQTDRETDRQRAREREREIERETPH